MDSKRKQIGVRYCGGCNPRFDRVALVRKLESLFPEEEFVPQEDNVFYPAVLVVCGCPARCVSVSDLLVPDGGMVNMCGPEELLPARDALRRILGRCGPA